MGLCHRVCLEDDIFVPPLCLAEEGRNELDTVLPTMRHNCVSVLREYLHSSIPLRELPGAGRCFFWVFTEPSDSYTVCVDCCRVIPAALFVDCVFRGTVGSNRGSAYRPLYLPHHCYNYLTS